MRTHLKSCLAAIALLTAYAFCGIDIYAQSSEKGLEVEDQYRYAMTVVKTVLGQPDGFHSTFVENPLVRLGDSASVAVIKLRTVQQLSDPMQMARVVRIIRSAFARPCAIDLAVDRSPNATLLLLQSMKSQAKDEKLKQQLDELMTYVQLAASQKCPASQD